MSDGSLGYQVVNVVRPVLDCRVTNASILLDNNFNYCIVQLVRLVNRSCATLDVVNVGVLISNDQSSFELPHVFGVYSEICLKRDVYFYALGDVDE